MKPCILLFAVTTCYIICGIHGIRQGNGRGFIFRGLGGRAGPFHLREVDSTNVLTVGDTNFKNNADLSPVIIPLNDVGSSFDEGAKSSANEYPEVAPQVNAVDPIIESGNGLIGEGNNADKYLNNVMLNNGGDLLSSEMHSSEEEDHDFSSNNFNIGGETADDSNVKILMPNTVDENIFDERHNNTKESLNVGIKGNGNDAFGGHIQDLDLGIGGDVSANNFKFAAQTNANEKRGRYIYPTYNEADNFNIGAKGNKYNFKLPLQERFHNFNVAAKGDIESGGFIEENSKQCECSSKSKGPFDVQGNAIHGQSTSVGQVNGGGGLNSKILNGGGYNAGVKGIPSSYYNFPVQNNKIHGFYQKWQGNDGRDPNIGKQSGGVFNKNIKGVSDRYLNYLVNRILGLNKGTQSGGGRYINYLNDNRINSYNAGSNYKPNSGGGFNVGKLASNYFNDPMQYNAIYRPYNADSRYISANGDGSRYINTKTQDGHQRGYNIAGNYYKFPKPNSMVQGFNTVGQNSFNAKGNGIFSNNHKALYSPLHIPTGVHGHNLASNANHEFYTEGIDNSNYGLNVEMNNDGGYSSKTKGYSMIDSDYKLPTHVYTENAPYAEEPSNKERFNIAGKDNLEVNHSEGKGFLIQNNLSNLNLQEANTNGDFNNAPQNSIINGEQINKESGPYFKIEENANGGFDFVPYRVPSCACQQGTENGGVNSQFQENVQNNIGQNLMTGEISSFEGNLAQQENLIGNLNDGVQSITENRLNDDPRGNKGNNLKIKGFNRPKNHIKEHMNLPRASSEGLSQNIAQNNFINSNLQKAIGHLASGINAGNFGGHTRWLNNFGGDVDPYWFTNIGSGFTNFIGTPYIAPGGGIYGGTGNGVPNNGAYGDGGFPGPENKLGPSNSEEFGHFKGQLDLIESKNDDALKPKIVRKGNKFGGLKGYLNNNLKKVFNGRPQSNGNGRLHANSFKGIESRLDDDGFRNDEKEFNNNINKFSDDKTNLLAPYQINTRKETLKEKITNYLLKILSPKQAEELGLIYPDDDGDQFSASNSIAHSSTVDDNNKNNNLVLHLNKDKKYSFPKLGPIARQSRFKPGFSARVSRLRDYNNVFRG